MITRSRSESQSSRRRLSSLRRMVLLALTALLVPGCGGATGPSSSPSSTNSMPTTWSTTWSGPSMSIDGQRYVIQLGPIDAHTILAELFRLDSNGHLTDLIGVGGGTVTGGQPMWGGGTSLLPNRAFGVFAEGSHDFTCALASGKPYPCTVATMPVTLDGRSYVAMAMTLPPGEDIKSFLGKVSWTDSAGTRHTYL